METILTSAKISVKIKREILNIMKKEKRSLIEAEGVYIMRMLKNEKVRKQL